LVRAKETTDMAESKPGEAPKDATGGRDAQQHDLAYEQAGGKEMPGLYPSNDIDDRDGDITPDAPDPHVEWDERVQPERADERAGEDIETEGT
jgi:hypothetical protein